MQGITVVLEQCEHSKAMPVGHLCNMMIHYTMTKAAPSRHAVSFTELGIQTTSMRTSCTIHFTRNRRLPSALISIRRLTAYRPYNVRRATLNQSAITTNSTMRNSVGVGRQLISTADRGHHASQTSYIYSVSCTRLDN